MQLLETSEEWAAAAHDRVEVLPDLVYNTASGVPLHVDVFRRRRLPGGAPWCAPFIEQPDPVVVFFHGGGWVVGSRSHAINFIIPYIARGYSVVNVEYRLANVARAPAAVEDARAVLRWLTLVAPDMGFDLDRVILAGNSAGGHLALMGAFLPHRSEFDHASCNLQPLPPNVPMTLSEIAPAPVAAVVNFYGAARLDDLLEGPTAAAFARAWLGERANDAEFVGRLGPVSYVRPGVCPVISVHGTADPLVPYAHSLELHERLCAAGVVNELVGIDGGGHGQFGAPNIQDAYRRIWRFLEQSALGPNAVVR
jgi:acetyl esterase/lipase